MQRDRMRMMLRHLGVNASNYKVLKLLPLVYVVWTSSKSSPPPENGLVDIRKTRLP